VTNPKYQKVTFQHVGQVLHNRHRSTVRTLLDLAMANMHNEELERWGPASSTAEVGVAQKKTKLGHLLQHRLPPNPAK
jgi:hypothetical protein